METPDRLSAEIPDPRLRKGVHFHSANTTAMPEDNARGMKIPE